MNALDMALQSALTRLITVAGVTATLADGSAVRGILEVDDEEHPMLAMQGAINPLAERRYTFQSVKAIPVGFKQVTIEGEIYNVSKCQRGQGCYMTYLARKETK